MLSKNLNEINIDFSKSKLKKIMKAIEKEKIKFYDVSLFSEECGAKFKFEGEEYEIVEEYEEVVSILKK